MQQVDIDTLVEQIRREQQISPFIDDEHIVEFIKEAEYSINYSVGATIDYTKDLEARSLLKNYVLYANHKRLAEFKELYAADYAALQIKYNRDS